MNHFTLLLFRQHPMNFRISNDIRTFSCRKRPSVFRPLSWIERRRRVIGVIGGGAYEHCKTSTAEAPTRPTVRMPELTFPPSLLSVAQTPSLLGLSAMPSLSLSPSEVVILRSPRATFAPTFPDVTHPSPFMKCRGEGGNSPYNTRPACLSSSSTPPLTP